MDLDKLQDEVEKLLGLLKDRHPGFESWHMFLKIRLESIQGMIEAAGICPDQNGESQ